MIKFKILRWALKIFIIISLLGVASNIHIIYMSTVANDLLTGVNTRPFYVSAFTILILTIGLFFIHESFTSFVRRGFFNLRSAKYLTRAGYLIVVTGLIGLVYNIAVISSANTAYKLLTSVILNCLSIIIGFGLTAVADIITKGENIKRENDLTI